MDAAEQASTWAIVEVMGHGRYAGFVSPHTALGAALIRVDVPATGDQQSFTKLFAPAALYSITPVTEEVARRVAANLAPKPVDLWDLRQPAAAIAYAGDDRHEDDDEEETYS